MTPYRICITVSLWFSQWQILSS